MQFVITLLSGTPYIDLAQNITGWVGWGLLAFLNLFLLIRFFQLHKNTSGGRPPALTNISSLSEGPKRILFSALFVAAPFAVLFFVVRFPDTGSLPLPGRIIESTGPLFSTFAALPWLLAAALLGLPETVLVSLATGIVLSFWSTHSPFTPLEITLLAILAYAAFHQRYRSLEFRLLRNPLFTACLLAIAYGVIFIYSNLFYAGGSLANRLDYAFSMVIPQGLVNAAELVLAGIFVWLIKMLAVQKSIISLPLQPSPWERSLFVRIIYSLAPLAALLLIAVLIGNWWIAGNAARRLLESRMASSAQLASQTLPYFLETGQNLIQQIAKDDRWFRLTSIDQAQMLQEARLSVPFFDELYLIAPDKSTAASYPPADYNASSPSPAEVAGLDLAFQGVPIQKYTVPAKTGARSAQVSFIAAVSDAQTGAIKGALIGRASLLSNPFTQPVLENLDSLDSLDGEGEILDDHLQVLYHTDPTRVNEIYQGITPEQATFYENKASDGTRDLVYFQPSAGYSWSVILTIPARQAQGLALEMAAPMLLITLAMFIVAGGILSIGLRFVTKSLKTLSEQANRMAAGQLDTPVFTEGSESQVDEVGQLSRAFEQMRFSLKARIDELNRLLLVGQGVASTLNINQATKPVLESALTTGAVSARIALGPAALPEGENIASQSTRFGAGPANERFAVLDDAILEMALRQDKLIINNLSRVRSLNLPIGAARPEALLAIALRHEQSFFGVLWIAFDQLHLFSEEEIRFIATLASQTTLAAANARLFQNAEIGRQRLASILASTADPVLVTDYQDRLILANPAAWHALGLNPDTTHGHAVNAVIGNPELANLLRQPFKESQSIEITAQDQRIYLATASPVMAGAQNMGKVCILRDVTHFKQLDALKSEFVSTVSHDLRSPLTLIRGYATMLDMVGQLNEQQMNYTQKIISGVDIMSNLVNNLLDLGRIEAGVNLQVELAEVSDIIKQVVEPLQGTANQKHIAMKTILPSEGLPPIQADQALLKQALHNLVENAIKYTDPGGKIQIQARTDANHIIFSISDSGIGIAPIDQPRLFERFFRGAQREARKRSGSGLGLAIVKSIADRHHGKVWVESQLGKGSTFSLLIPIQQPKIDVKSERSPLTE